MKCDRKMVDSTVGDVWFREVNIPFCEFVRADETRYTAVCVMHFSGPSGLAMKCAFQASYEMNAPSNDIVNDHEKNISACRSELIPVRTALAVI